MTEQTDLLAERFAALTNRHDDSDWLDVHRRARVSARRRLVLPIAAAVALIGAGSAFALYRGGVDFLGAKPAPERIQLDFDSLRQQSAAASAQFGGPKYTPEGPAREVMRAQIAGEAQPLWVVPTTEGGFCYRLLFATSCPDVRQRDPIGITGLASADGDGFDWIAGPVSDGAVQEVELVYQDGERAKVPFVWVSAPIDAGFYAYDVPKEHQESGDHIKAVLGLDADRKIVARACAAAPSC